MVHILEITKSQTGVMIRGSVLIRTSTVYQHKNHGDSFFIMFLFPFSQETISGFKKILAGECYSFMYT